MRFSHRKTSSYLVILLFAVYLINGIIAIPENSIVYDEPDHWSYGKRILMGQPQKVYTYDDGSEMPVQGINALPRAVEQLLNPGLKKTDGGVSDIMHGRYVTLFLCFLTGVYIWRWSTELFKESAGVFSLFLFVFCPNLNANAILLSTDAYTALFTLITFYYFWKFVKERQNKFFLLFCLSCAASQVVKYSLIHLPIIFGILSLLVLLQRKSLWTGWKRNILRLLVFVSVFLIVINAAYFFIGSGQALAGYHFRSELFKSLQSFQVLSKLPLPFPVPYIDGFDITFHMMELGTGHPLLSGKTYLLGEYRTGKGFWYYYLVLFLFKTPIPFLIAFFLLAWFYLKQWKISFLSADFFIGFGLLYYFLLFSFINDAQIGLRHVIFFYPLLYVLAGKLTQFPWRKISMVIVIPLLAVYTIASYYFFFPNLISYSNEFIPDKKKVYKVMADTNIDYGQGWIALNRYLKNHDKVKMAPLAPEAGIFVIGLNDYLDLYNTGKYAWLRNFEPVGHVNHCFLLFSISIQDIHK